MNDASPTPDLLEIPAPRWVISDTHIGHGPILAWYPWRREALGVAEPPVDERGRPCPSAADLAAHDRAIVEAWREVVRRDDVVLHVGDVAWGGEACGRWLHRLPGKVFVAKGNHDRAADLRGWAAGIASAVRFTMPDGRRVLARHKPAAFRPADAANCDVLLHGHTHAHASTVPEPGEPGPHKDCVPKLRNCCVDWWRQWAPIPVEDVLLTTPFERLAQRMADGLARKARLGLTDEQIRQEMLARFAATERERRNS